MPDIELSNAILNTALTYGAQGLPVIPLNGKIPRVMNGSKDHSVDTPSLQRWWRMWPDADIGICTGHPLPGGGKLIVIDIDTAHDGRASWNALTHTYGKPYPVDTYRVDTQSGGSHLYLRVPEACNIRNFQSRRDGFEGIDLRGTGGYVVAPPSMRGAYTVASDTDIAWMTDAWIELITTKPRRAQATSLSERKGKVSIGARHQTMVSLLGTMHARGMTPESMFAAMRTEIDTSFEDGSQVPDENIQIAIKSIVDLYEQGDRPEVQITALGDARDLLSGLAAMLKDDPGAYCSPEVLAAYCTVEELDSQAAARALAAMKKAKAPSTMFKNALKQFKAKNREAAGLQATIDLEGVPLTYVWPEKWSCRQDGVHYLGGEDGPERVLPVALYLTRRLRTVEEQEEKVELQYQRDGETHRLVVDRSVAGQARTITSLADRGLPVTSENAGKLVRYIHDLEAANLLTIPLEEATTQAGWIGSSHFYPGAEGTIQFAPPDWSDINERAFAPQGDEEAWKTSVATWSAKHPLLRLDLAASFAASLLKPAGHRSFVVHLWGDSGGGKTASLMAAMSVWGNPSKLMANFNTTAVGLESRMALMNGLPVGLNERQVGGKSGDVDRLVYMAGEGTGRTRGAKAGGLRRTAHWQMILLTNGEEPLIGESAPEGVRTRVLEYMGRPIDDEDAARALYGVVERNHGWAGRTFAARLVETLRSDPTAIRSLHDQWMTFCGSLAPDRVVSHVSALALCATADVLAARWVFGASDDASMDATQDWIEGILADTPKRGDRSEGQREYDFICDLVKANRTKFAVGNQTHVDGAHETWGVLKNSAAYMIPSVFDRELDRAGFRPRAAKNRLLKLEKLKTDRRDGSEKRLTRKMDGSRYVSIVLDNELWNGLTARNEVGSFPTPSHYSESSIDD